jgi:hypothetical protein
LAWISPEKADLWADRSGVTGPNLIKRKKADITLKNSELSAGFVAALCDFIHLWPVNPPFFGADGY